jgi:hypothetical protein
MRWLHAAFAFHHILRRHIFSIIFARLDAISLLLSVISMRARCAMIRRAMMREMFMRERR